MIDDIMGDLASQLDANSTPATYNAVLDMLAFDSSLCAGCTLFWASTDTGLELTGQLAGPVPKPGTLLLLGSGFAGFAGAAAWKRRRRPPPN